MRRRVFGETHSIFRAAFRSFLEKEVVPAYPAWEEQGYPDRELFRRAGEPGLRSISTLAVRDGGELVINGAKPFSSNGSIADIVLTVVRTGDGPGRDSHSLLVVPADSPGFSRGRRLRKIGLKAQDLAELSYQDVRVPCSNLLGEEGKAFAYLTGNLAQERLSIALNSQAAAEAALDTTIRYVNERRAFGTPIASFQNTKSELAACATESAAGRA